ncbi:hypothetical protein RIF29_33463 [Crotalaria pallida]|uniref:Uncharacterized protein n=1 Tax=Crotalaria pallida TaxID=3830 RepID=A0AAN9EDP9_CROPI
MRLGCNFQAPGAIFLGALTPGVARSAGAGDGAERNSVGVHEEFVARGSAGVVRDPASGAAMIGARVGADTTLVADATRVSDGIGAQPGAAGAQSDAAGAQPGAAGAQPGAASNSVLRAGAQNLDHGAAGSNDAHTNAKIYDTRVPSV